MSSRRPDYVPEKAIHLCGNKGVRYFIMAQSYFQIMVFKIMHVNEEEVIGCIFNMRMSFCIFL